MKAKLIVEGKEFEVELNPVAVEKLVKPNRKTGYERVEKGMPYCFVDADGTLNGYDDDEYDDVDNVYYEQANYYSEVIVAENNARADKLMRQLRRFAVEHREKELNWEPHIAKSYIYYDHNNGKLDVHGNDVWRIFGAIYFDSKSTAEFAIELFHDELIWYFTEYKDSL